MGMLKLRDLSPNLLALKAAFAVHCAPGFEPWLLALVPQRSFLKEHTTDHKQKAPIFQQGAQPLSNAPTTRYW